MIGVCARPSRPSRPSRRPTSLGSRSSASPSGPCRVRRLLPPLCRREPPRGITCGSLPSRPLPVWSPARSSCLPCFRSRPRARRSPAPRSRRGGPPRVRTPPPSVRSPLVPGLRSRRPTVRSPSSAFTERARAHRWNPRHRLPRRHPPPMCPTGWTILLPRWSRPCSSPPCALSLQRPPSPSRQSGSAPLKRPPVRPCASTSVDWW